MPSWRDHIVFVTKAKTNQTILIVFATCLSCSTWTGPARATPWYNQESLLAVVPSGFKLQRLDFLLMALPPAEKDCSVCHSVRLSVYLSVCLSVWLAGWLDGWDFTSHYFHHTIAPPACCWRTQEPRSLLSSSSSSSILWIWPQSTGRTGSLTQLNTGSLWNNGL